MKHLPTRYVAERVGNGISRTIVEQVDDTKLMQYHVLSGFAGEKQQNIENVHPYGYVSVVQPPTGSGSQRLGAEGFMGFMGGGRSHGVVFVAGDRRFRLYKLQNGEVALHDDQGQQIHLRRDGIWGSVPQSKQIRLQIMDSDALPQDSGGSGGQKMGQIQQAGRSATINLVMDKNQFTLNHPNGVVTMNCASFLVNASGDARVDAGGNALLHGGSAAILYSPGGAYIRSLGVISAKADGALLAQPLPWSSPAVDPPITS